MMPAYLKNGDLQETRRKHRISNGFARFGRNHHLISRAVIAALPSHAVFINLARGLLVDEAALVEALAARRIAGAGLTAAGIQ